MPMELRDKLTVTVEYGGATWTFAPPDETWGKMQGPGADVVKITNHIFAKLLTGWAGVTLDGEELECSAENKAKFPFALRLQLAEAFSEAVREIDAEGEESG